MRKIVFILFVIVVFAVMPAKSSVITDSLIVELHKAKGEAKVDILNLLSRHIRYTDKDKATEYASNALTLSEAIEYRRGIANSYVNIGIINRANFVVSYEYFSKALYIYRELGAVDQQVSITHTLGNTYYYHSDYPKALGYYLDALKLAEKNEDKLSIANAIQNIGNVYYSQKKYTQAIMKYSEALDLYTNLDFLRGIAGCNMNIGVIHYIEKNYYNGLKYLKNATNIYQKMLVVHEKDNNSTAIYRDKESIGNCLNNKACIFRDMKDYTKALETHREAIALHINDGAGSVLIDAYMNIGKVFIQNSDYKQALHYSLKAVDLFDSKNVLSTIQGLHLQVSQVYDSIGNKEMAYVFYRKHIAINDSIFSKDKEKIIEDMKFKYETEKKEQHIITLEKDKKAEKQKKYALIFVIFILILISVVVILLQRSKARNMRELMEKRKEINKSNKLLMETQLKNTELERNRLKSELEAKNRELTNFALHIVQKNDLLLVLKKETGRLKKVAASAETLKIVNELSTLIYQSLNIEKDRTDFQNYIKDISESFFVNLEERFPELTGNEKRLATLLRLNLSSKDISSILNIAVKSVEMSRYRLRKKLGLDSGDNISEFLCEI